MKFIWSLVAISLIFASPPALARSEADCQNALDLSCHSVQADQPAGEFHGLIMVPGEPGVLEAAAHSGTQPGCGDCVWTLIMACVINRPGQTGGDNPCNGSGQPQQCDRGQVLYRLYLSTDAAQNQLVQTLCLGGDRRVVDVGGQAAIDVQRYLKDVTPPDLALGVQPPHGLLANLPAYFVVKPPADLRPRPFGNGQITETITIEPAHYTWHWGDDTDDLRTDDPGGPYPTGHVTHTYALAGHVHGQLTTDWSATYTITIPGAGTFGPYDATGGTISKTQPFDLIVDAAHSHLVSHA